MPIARSPARGPSAASTTTGSALGGPVVRAAASTRPRTRRSSSPTSRCFATGRTRPALRATVPTAGLSERRLQRGADRTRARHRSARPADHGERDLRSAHDAHRQRPGRPRSVPQQRHPARAVRSGRAEDPGADSRAGQRRAAEQLGPGHREPPVSDGSRPSRSITTSARHEALGYWSAQFTDQITAPDGLPIPITARRDQKIYGHTFRVNVDKTLTPTLLLHAGVGYLRFHNPDSSPDEVLNYDAVGELGFVGSATDPVGLPRDHGPRQQQRRRLQQLSMGPGNANKYYNDKLTASANSTCVRSKHMFKFGGEFKQEVWTDINKTYSQGQLFFNARRRVCRRRRDRTSAAAASASATRASCSASSIRRRSRPCAIRNGESTRGACTRRTTGASSRKLTLDYGLRWDYGGQGHERILPHQPGRSHHAESLGGRSAWRVRLRRVRWTGTLQLRVHEDLSVRVRPAARQRPIKLDDKTVVRAGWGITYSALSNWWYVTGGSSTLGVGFNSLNWTNPAFGEAALRLRDGLQLQPGRSVPASLDPGIRPSPGQLNVPPAWGAQINDPERRPAGTRQPVEHQHPARASQEHDRRSVRTSAIAARGSRRTIWSATTRRR